MANETVLATSASDPNWLAHPTDVYADAMLPALINGVVVMPLIYKTDLPNNTTVKYVQKAGYLTAASSDVAENGAHTTFSQMTRTGVSITVGKTVVSSLVTVEALQFGSISQQDLSNEQGAALARKLDSKVTDLFDNFTNGVTSASVLTLDDLIDADYTVVNALYGNPTAPRVFVGSAKQIKELQAEMAASAASQFTIPAQIQLLGGIGASVSPQGYVGSYQGINCFRAFGLPTSAGDTVGLLFDPSQAFAGMYAASPQVMIIPVGTKATSGSFSYEVSSFIFNGVSEWRDEAGCMVKSDT